MGKRRHRASHKKGSSSAARAEAALKKKGPVAAGGLGGPPPDTEGQREAVITQENTNGSGTSPPLSPASTNSDASLPGLSQEGDTPSIGNDSTTISSSSTPCVTCESEVPSCGSVSEILQTHPQDNTRPHESTGNSVSDSVGQSIAQNGVKKDSEYESAEELDSATYSSPQSEEASRVPSTTVTPEGGSREEYEPGESGCSSLGDLQTDANLPSLSSVNAPSGDETPNPVTVELVNGVETDATSETAPVISTEISTNAGTDTVNSAESEQPVTTVCESILTVTQNEVVEESILENTVLVEQQVISATHTATNSTSPEPEKPVDVSDINLELGTSGGDREPGTCDPPTCLSGDVSEAKETSDQEAPGEGGSTPESQVDGRITEEPIVSEAISGAEHTAHSSEVSSATPQEAEQSVVKSEEPQEARDTPAPHDPDQHTAVESTSQASSPPPEHVEEFSPPLPSQETGETPAPAPEQYTAVESTSQASSPPPEQVEESPPPLPPQEARETPAPAPEQYTAVESTSQASSSSPEQPEESPPFLPPPDPDDLPIAPKKGYNLDFLDCLDDPNFNPFASKTAIRNTPPPSPEPGHKLPPLKPAVKKKGKKTPETTADKQKEPESSNLPKDLQDQSSREREGASPQPSQDTRRTPELQQEEAELKAKSSVLEIPVDDGDTPAKTPVKPVRKPAQRRPLKKTPPKPKVTEQNNNRVEEKEEKVVSQVQEEDADLPIPPSKGYNLDFLDSLDDPNFNPFSSKTAIRNSPPSSGAAFPASQDSQETPTEQEAKVVVAPKKPSPKKGFNVPKKKEVKRESPEASERSLSQENKKQESIEVSDTKKPETSPSKEEPKQEEEEEIPVPKKGYNLDFLDDPNFDPFQSKSPLDKAKSGAKTAAAEVAANAEGSVITNTSAKCVESKDKPDHTSADASLEEGQPELVSEPTSESEKEVSADSAVPRESPEEEKATQVFTDNPTECAEESLTQELTDKPKNQNSEPDESYATKDDNHINQTVNQNLTLQPLGLDLENNWNTEDKPDAENTEPYSGVFRTPSVGTIGQLDSLEFEELLEHEASRIAEEFMNCSRDSGLPDYDESPESNHNHNNHSTMADMNCTNIHQVDENVNPFQRNSKLSNSPPLGKRGAVCGAESTDSFGRPFSSRRALKRDIVMGEERLDTSSLEDDSGIALGSRSDLEEEVNHSEAGPEIATGLTSSDLKCASQLNSDDLEDDDDEEEEFSDRITDEEFLSSETFFKEVTDFDIRRTPLMSPLLGSPVSRCCLMRHSRQTTERPVKNHSKLVGDDVTPTKDKKEPPAGAPESPQNKPTPSTSSPAPPPREERSAPEGTSSPSPRPSDTAERKSLSARPTSAPPDGYMTASEVQELLKRQELKFEEKLLRVELSAGEKEKKLQQTMKDEQKELQNLGSSVTELTQSRDALLKMVGQYKGMLASLVSEKEKEKKASEDKIAALQAERDQALEDLANVEVAFSDVHRKYERTKQVVDTLKRNEETLRGAVADYEAKLKKQEQKFLEFQKHAEEKIQLANEEFESMRKCNEQEMTKMAALLKKAEMKIMSLQDSFDRKTRENQELTQLCDDLINKVGTSH
ncbi:transforming acidic coiled-coil-containing protein 2-like isoform X9 [Eriocheir sinensis]|uniref:transforming acidic coiled-coil-containing protein 2-like isoform X9 n=1 Tax=Eriocheir sinensis TaxID=95602 RepID=UPI0021C6E817|nr:transforming acidic coiled-coil-containing protein 2-like isoform X9 [Eriocheir sinensis]